MTKPPMVMRSFRVPEPLWLAALVKADEREENLSDVLREALERYVKRSTPKRRAVDPCPVCGAKVEVVEGVSSIASREPKRIDLIAKPCGHRVDVTVWPDRVELR